jgi:hypothetical protein
VQEYRVIAFTTKMYQWQFSPVDSSLPFALTDCPASYCAAQTVLTTQQTATAEQNNYCYMCYSRIEQNILEFYCARVWSNCIYNWNVSVTILARGRFITVRTHWLSSFVLCCSDSSSYAADCCRRIKQLLLRVLLTQCSRDTLGKSSYKQQKVEGNYIPPMPGLKRGEN